MKRIWIYSVAASGDPDRIECVVPWRINDEFIFFGPCKKRIRENIRKKFIENPSKSNCSAPHCPDKYFDYIS